jgi:YidC/Oxa1 family membrane protein insertase
MMKYIFRGMMPVLGYFSTTFPAGVLVYWATTNVFSVVQLLVLQVPVVRQWAKFPKRIQHPKNPYAEDKAGFMGKLRAARDQLTDSKPATVKTVERAPSSANARNEALREILDDKAAYDAEPKSAAADAEAKEAKRNRDRVLKARQRRARQ